MDERNNPAVIAHTRMLEAEELRQQGKHVQARKICEALIKRYPDYVAALHTLGLVLADSGDYDRALSPLVRAAMLNPRDWRTLTALSGVYLKLGSHLMAARTLEEALTSRPEDVATLGVLAEIYSENDEFELAADAFTRALRIEPTLREIRLGLGEAYMDLGAFTEAANVFEALFDDGVRPLSVLYNLGQLPAAVSNIDILPAVDALTKKSDASQEDWEASLAFTTASAHDKAGNHAAAWKDLLLANRRKRERLKAEQAQQRKDRADLLADARNDEKLPAASATLDEGVPISLFLLGPSRSGKTTLERLIAALADVKRGYENSITDNVARRVFHSSGFLVSDSITDVPKGLRAMAREFYKEELADRAGGASVFTITTPGLVSEAAALAAIVPNARFMFIKRDLDDIAFRIFSKSYARGNAYSYSLEGIREFVGWYYDLIDIWAARMPEITRIVQYEDMIEDPAAVLDAASDLCGLPRYMGEPPQPGDDRGCSLRYRAMMQVVAS